jgi:hypothetical protein
MKNIKVWFSGFVLVTIVWFSSMGCVTKQVWKDPVKSTEYNETIISFYTNFQKQEIVFIGEQYHYFFQEKSEKFIELLKAKELLNLSDKNLQIHASTGYRDPSKMDTDIMVHFKKSQLNSKQLQWLEAQGFNLIQADPHFGETTPHIYLPNEQVPMVEFYTFHYNLRGLRYVAKKEVNTQVVKLKKPLMLPVTEFHVEKKSTLYKIAMTPLSITADAGLIVVGVGAAIVYAPFALTYMAYEKIKGN